MEVILATIIGVVIILLTLGLMMRFPDEFLALLFLAILILFGFIIGSFVLSALNIFEFWPGL